MTPIDYPTETGLSEEIAQVRLQTEGYNELTGTSSQSILTLILGVIKEPMLLLLVAAGLIYLFLGDTHEALMLMSFVVLIMGITLYQEHKTEKTLSALRNLSSPRALVIREGNRIRIPGREVVREDLIVLAEGDRVAADASLISSRNFMVDESLLTGESLPVRKLPVEDETREPDEKDGRIFAGSMVVQGQGIARVTAIGSHTEMGKIGSSLQSVERGETRLKNEINSLVKILTIIAAVLCIIVIITYGIRNQDWISGLLAGITLAMAILPEEIPIVLTIFLALGAWRMARKNVLTRQIPAIETLGSATVLCVDKTGTITENRMTVQAFYADGTIIPCKNNEGGSIEDPCHEIVEYAILACRQDPFDPMEKALRALENGEFAETEHIHKTWELVQEYPLSDDLLAMSNVWRSPNRTSFIVASKGAPEAIGDLCHLSDPEMAELRTTVDQMATKGLRVLGIARSVHPLDELPTVQHDFVYQFLGLVGFADPVRPEIDQAIQECYTAGIRVVMITGDYPQTASCIAREAGLTAPDQVITGTDLTVMSDDELARRSAQVSVFARTVPEQKLRIIQALKSSGEIVAMTGDGVNDAPALRAADIGIAMGMRGTDVAREAASLVLLDDNFASIVSAVRMGRRIFDNLKKAMAYIFAVHVPIAGLSVIPVILGWPLMLLPAHVVFLQMIIDPTCSIAFELEPEESGVMKRPPRSTADRLFSPRLISICLIEGFVILGVLTAIFVTLMGQDAPDDYIRTILFSTLVFANLGLIMVNRSWTEPFYQTFKRQNPAMWVVVALALVLLALVLLVPLLRELFRFTPLTGGEVGLCAIAGFLSVIWFEGYKFAQNSRNE
ncbi:MAG: ATPase [Methanomicrobiales archaeon HGW-Methanomicrobiales-4]|nr:MAG: ATPase [Methanomicrobiales archaeon HGW-Methanomicrobiales-4]